MLRLIDHPNAIKLCEVFESEKFVHLIFPYFEGTDLTDFTRGYFSFKEHEVKQIVR